MTSALTMVETRRAVLRATRELRLGKVPAARAVQRARRLLSGWEIVPVDDAILERAARSFRAEPVRTLDAIHLASIERAVRAFDGLAVVSLDDRVRANVSSRGWELLP